MNQDYWHRQTKEQPLFPELLWSRPENRLSAGKLLVIGGNLHSFTAPAETYTEAIEAGIGAVRVLLPDALAKTVGRVFPEAEFAPSTPSGSFAQSALALLLDAAAWADGVLVAGSLGHNSETAIMLEKFVAKYTGLITMVGDSFDDLLADPQLLLQRKQTTLALSFSQLQTLIKAAKFPTAITSTMDILRFVEFLHDFTRQHAANIITEHNDMTIVGAVGQIGTTPKTTPLTAVAARASVWWVQDSRQPFAALSSSLVGL